MRFNQNKLREMILNSFAGELAKVRNLLIECITNGNLNIYQKARKYQSECITNMKMITNLKPLLKIIENKLKDSECKIEGLIQCQTKVKLNVK